MSLDGEQTSPRASLMASQMLGLAMMREVLANASLLMDDLDPAISRVALVPRSSIDA